MGQVAVPACCLHRNLSDFRIYHLWGPSQTMNRFSIFSTAPLQCLRHFKIQSFYFQKTFLRPRFLGTAVLDNCRNLLMLAEFAGGQSSLDQSLSQSSTRTFSRPHTCPPPTSNTPLSFPVLGIHKKRPFTLHEIACADDCNNHTSIKILWKAQKSYIFGIDIGTLSLFNGLHWA